MIVTVNVSWDISAGVLTHNVLAPPAVPTPTPMISVEMVATQFWPPGYALNQNKLTTTVKHKGVSIVQDGHDCGALVLDITPPVMPNLYYAIMWPFSSRKITFACSKTKMNGQSVGAAQLFCVPLPMMTCGDPISAPTALALTNKLNSVDCGISWFDILVGVVMIAASILIDYIGEKIKPGGFSLSDTYGRHIFRRELVEQIAATATESIARQLLKEGLGKMIPTSVPGLIKKGLGVASDFAISVLQGNPTVKVGVGGGPLSASGGWEANPTPTESNPDPSHWSAEGNGLGVQRDTRGGGANWGSSL